MALPTGVAAPDFTLRNQHGEPVSPSAWRDVRPVVLVFFPFAFTNVCTGELLELRDHAGELEAAGAQVLAVSCDPMPALRVFADEHRLSAVPLLSDFWPHGEVSRRYDVFNDRLGCSSRATYIVGRDGVVRWVVENEIPQARALGDYLEVLQGLK